MELEHIQSQWGGGGVWSGPHKLGHADVQGVASPSPRAMHLGLQQQDNADPV